MRRKNYVEALLDGYKPAIWIETYGRLYPQVAEKDFPREAYGDEMYVIFQNEALKREFVERMEEANGDEDKETYIMGSMLGFPERSVTYFCDLQKIERETGENPYKLHHIGMEWAGFSFSTHLDMALDEARQLWATYEHPQAIIEPMYLWTIETSYIEVPYKDYNALEKACEYIMQQRGLVPAVVNE